MGTITLRADPETSETGEAGAVVWGPSALRDPSVMLSSIFGVGFLPKMPGTWGSIVAVLLWYGGPQRLPLLLQLLLCLAIFVLGVWAIGRIHTRFEVRDAGEIVIDELLGMWLVLILVPANLWAVLLAFATFRLFDITKPWPVSWADRQHTPVGVMLDDVLAGILAWCVVQVAVWLFGGALGASLLPGLF